MNSNTKSFENIDLDFESQSPEFLTRRGLNAKRDKTSFVFELNLFFTKSYSVKAYALFLLLTVIISLLVGLVVLSVIPKSYSEIPVTTDQPSSSIITISDDPFTTTIDPLAPNTTTSDPFGDGVWQLPSLTDNIIPLSYNIQFRVFPEFKTYEGLVQIEAINKLANNDVIVLHATEILNIGYPIVNLYENETQTDPIQLNVISSFIYSRHDYFVMKLNRNLTQNSRIQINLDFDRDLDTNENNGFFYKSFIDEAKIKR